MGIITTKDTKYYELDWYVPTEPTDKVYIAIKGNIEKNTDMNITADGVGYKWEENEDSKIKPISQEEFLKKARNDNIVYFHEDNNNYNNLLNYPEDMQRYIDIELYKYGFKPHNKIPLRTKLNIIKEQQRSFRLMKSTNSEKIINEILKSLER